MANLNFNELEFRTRREQMRDSTKIALQRIIGGITSDAVLLAEVVAGGPSMWRGVFLTQTKGLAVTVDIADKLYVMFCEAWKIRAKDMQFDGDAGAFLDKVEIKPKLTEQEIEDAWEVDVVGHEDAIRQFYVDQPAKTLPKKVTINGVER